MQENPALRAVGSHANDEFDLVALFRVLWDQRVFIAVMAALVFFVAAGYAFLSRPYYEARVGLLPPNVSDIAGYNLGRTEVSGLKSLDVKDVYSIFLRSLNSDSLRRAFFDEFYIPAQEGGALPNDVLWERFGKVLSVGPVKGRSDYWEVRVGGEDPAVAAAWVDTFVSMAAARAEDSMRQNISGEVSTRVQAIEQQIEVLRDTVKQRREDRIAVLQEALEVAESVGLDTPQGTMWQTFSNAPSSAFDGSPLYLRGAKAIRAELEVLTQRKSDDPFIPELRSLQERLQFLKAMDTVPQNAAVFAQDGPTQIPDRPIKPKKTLILALGLVLGFMLGAFVALVRGFWRRAPSLGAEKGR